MKKFLLLTMLICSLVLGCSQSDNPSSGTIPDDTHGSNSHDESGHDHSVHAHPTHGPNGGELIELGQEDYHAELVHSDNGISLYLLDSAATTTVSINAKSLTLGLKKDGEVRSFELTAQAGTSNDTATSNHFVSKDETLHTWLDEGAEGVVTIEIDGKSYTGKVAHDHDGDHSGHDHSGHDHNRD